MPETGSAVDRLDGLHEIGHRRHVVNRDQATGACVSDDVLPVK
jgi:hypothetical protein